jgi:hypothetical protein
MAITIRLNDATRPVRAQPHRQHVLRTAAALICLTALGLPTAVASEAPMTPFQIPDGAFAQGRGPREPRRPTGLPAQQYLASPAARGLADGNCSAPYKIASGACVLVCPGGYDDRGSACISRRD